MHVEIDSINNIGGHKFWGVRIYEEVGGKRIGTYNISLAVMQEMNVLKRQSERRKFVDWLASEAGCRWLEVSIENPSHTTYGAFLKAVR